jgi:V8-like Glu-specific endopeptidase
MRKVAAIMVAATAVVPLEGSQFEVTTPGTDFTGTAEVNNCSAFLVRYADSQPTDKALVLTNGHCYEGGAMMPGQVLVDVASSRSISLLKPDASPAGTVKATRLRYGTGTKTDVIVYEVNETYASIKSRLGVPPLTLAKQAPAAGTPMSIVSSYRKTIYTCSVQATIPQVREGDRSWQDSIKYRQPGCETIGGTSGSPVIDTSTGEVIGVNNTGNDDGERCLFNNACELDADGNVTVVEQGADYGQQTWWLYTCLTADRVLDLGKPGCRLPAPARH